MDRHVFHLGSWYSLFEMIGLDAYGQVISTYDSLLQRKIATNKKLKLPSINAVAAKLFILFKYLIIIHQQSTDKSIITNSHISHFLYQLLQALKFIHSAKVYLKPSNIFVDLDSHVRIGDLGLARVPEEVADIPTTDYGKSFFLKEILLVFTRWYRSPELMLCDGAYTSAMDTWSIGCILGEVIFGQPSFPSRCYWHQTLSYSISII